MIKIGSNLSVAQINESQLKQNYPEGDSIEYHCELDGLKLVGNPSRRCQRGQWIGSIPRCGNVMIFHICL